MGVVVHVGFQKTASTTLQGTIFPRVDGTFFLNREDEFFEFARSIEGRPGAEPFTPDRWRPFLDGARRRAPTLLLSREDFSNGRRSAMVADRLHAVLPDARILVCVRSQATMLASLYSQHLKSGGFSSFRAWLGRFPIEALEYDHLVCRYQELFGDHAVTVMAFEHLLEDPDGFVAALCDAISPGSPPVRAAGVSAENRGLAAPSRWAFRAANRLFRRSRWNERPPLPAAPVWRVLESAVRRVDPIAFPTMDRMGTRADRQLVEGLLPRFGSSNARLQAMAGVDLGRFGYPLASGAVTPTG